MTARTLVQLTLLATLVVVAGLALDAAGVPSPYLFGALLV
ncbi:MAG: hypothetical protein QOH62_1820, partial [Solirubrobacteraceae bacterium]|nr:hypothetical protein [Solirubrobacteraceae bacterium]